MATSSSLRRTTPGAFDPTALRGSDAARIARMQTDVEGVRTYVWQLWPGRNYPCTAAEEATFVRDLREAAEKSRPKGENKKRRAVVERGDITSVMNALRCGLTFEELSKRAPGLKAHRLLAAYEEVDRLRLQSVNAWVELCEDGGLEAIVNWSQAASVLMGTPVRRVSPNSPEVSDKTLREQVRVVQEKVAAVGKRAERVEFILDEKRCSAREAVELGRLLYDPYDPSLWADPYFLPGRVGTLMPLRLADLLGERHP
jgi:hypothetical protein